MNILNSFTRNDERSMISWIRSKSKKMSSNKEVGEDFLNDSTWWWIQAWLMKGSKTQSEIRTKISKTMITKLLVRRMKIGTSIRTFQSMAMREKKKNWCSHLPIWMKRFRTLTKTSIVCTIPSKHFKNQKQKTFKSSLQLTNSEELKSYFSLQL